MELVCTGAQMQTELQHASSPYQKREGSTLLWAFCLAATTKNSLPGRVCSSCFSPVTSLLSFICRVQPRDHPSRQWSHYLSGVKARGKVTEVAVSALLKTPPKACSYFLRGTVKFSGWTKMNRKGTQVRGRGSPLKATPVFIVGVVVLVLILCVYLELMLTFPWWLILDSAAVSSVAFCNILGKKWINVWDSWPIPFVFVCIYWSWFFK